jgi:hypothetical protein
MEQAMWEIAEQIEQRKRVEEEKDDKHKYLVPAPRISKRSDDVERTRGSIEINE